ncbi:fcp1 [Candida pseudojiufengensis]|uniref:fcp1 n=1 Tax=Candida pseudojiufengensis TaxID=497109 RepID=UPI00222481D5|nr:fcp1 [Candida pseudojiufengensis]KAI5959149.1 fcp1 [Candida pseudojiufengensis]
MSESTPIKLPSSLPFPVIISSILCSKGESITKHKEIFKYKYWVYQDDPNSKDEPPKKIRVERIGTFESPIEGIIEKINVFNNEEILHNDIEILNIKELCTHTVQYGGLCALCGKSLEEEKDYSGYDFEDRATISMSHDNTGLKISFDEAAKIEMNTTDRLNEEKKLILVVDLDQTVIHATVDPTVGEWQSDPSNPNYPAVKDVKTFCLEEDPIVPPGWTGPKLPPTKCWYYVKIRPGLSEFLKNMNNIYEMHIYTMATRNYALAIAKIIDPDGKYFGDRILSRDESGSLTHKNLKRLFPVDQSMVVIIDDRGDVWQWENNLIKVVPYDFFVGIGDINSSFLPKKNGQLTGPIKKRKSIAKLEAAAENNKTKEDEENSKDSQSQSLSQSQTQSSQSQLQEEATQEDPKEITTNPVERILELGGGEDNTNLLLEQSITRNQSIEQQQHDRPLAKLQHDLDQLHEHKLENNTNKSSTNGSGSGSSSSSSSSSDSEDSEFDEDLEDDNLLYDDDNELILLNKVLDNIHKEYYLQYSKLNKPNLTKIIPYMKSQVLKGITILFSGIIPLGINLNSADIVIWCKQFGVKVVNEVYPDITHVICKDINENSGPTLKVRIAKKLYGNKIKIVNPDWLFFCLSNWSKVDETEYLINNNDEKLWDIKQSEIDKYLKKLDNIQKKRNDESKIGSNDLINDDNDENDESIRLNSIDKFEDYDLDEANQEVDDFLAGLSDEDDDDDEDNDDDDEEEEDEEEENINTNGHDSFIKDVYKKKRKLEVDNEEEEEEEEDSENNTTINDKKRKTSKNTDNNESIEDNDDDNQLNIDAEDLEQELLNGFDDLNDD